MVDAGQPADGCSGRISGGSDSRRRSAARTCRMLDGESSQQGRKVSEVKHLKAVPCAWLVCQEDPGLPYGTDIKAQFFRHNSSAAQAFIAWYKRAFPDANAPSCCQPVHLDSKAPGGKRCGRSLSLFVIPAPAGIHLQRLQVSTAGREINYGQNRIVPANVGSVLLSWWWSVNEVESCLPG